MKPLFYKSLLLFLAFTGGVLGQKHTVLNKSFDVGSAKVVELDLKNIPLTILPSLDNKIHIDFTMDFKGFSEQEVKTKMAKVKFNKSTQNSKILLSIKSETIISPVYFHTNDKLSISSAKFLAVTDELKKVIPKNKKRKSKERIIKSIESNDSEREGLFDELISHIEKNKNSKIQKANFHIYIPQNLILKIKSQGGFVISKLNTMNNISAEVNGGLFKAKKVFGENVTIKIKNAYLKIAEIENATVDLIDMEGCLIGSVNNSQIKSETSKIEIGEIQENVKIKDFDGEYFLYNFIKDYKDFNFDGDYSKIHYYQPNFNVSAKVFGYNCILDNNGILGKVNPGKQRKRDLMFIINPETEKKVNKTIRFDLTDGIFYLNPTSNKKN